MKCIRKTEQVEGMVKIPTLADALKSKLYQQISRNYQLKLCMAWFVLMCNSK